MNKYIRLRKCPRGGDVIVETPERPAYFESTASRTVVAVTVSGVTGNTLLIRANPCSTETNETAWTALRFVGWPNNLGN